MSKFHQAADTLKREASRYAALNEAAKVLDELGSLDQAANEAKQMTIANTKEADELREQVNTLKETAKKQLEVAAAKSREIDESNIAAIDAATEKANKIIADAEARGGEVVADALNRAQTATNAIKEQLDKLEAEKKSLSAEVSKLHDEAAASNLEADVAEKRLAKIKASIAQLAGV
jgi:chromosome segregation ATPase